MVDSVQITAVVPEQKFFYHRVPFLQLMAGEYRSTVSGMYYDLFSSSSAFSVASSTPSFVEQAARLALH